MFWKYQRSYDRFILDESDEIKSMVNSRHSRHTLVPLKTGPVKSRHTVVIDCVSLKNITKVVKEFISGGLYPNSEKYITASITKCCLHNSLGINTYDNYCLISHQTDPVYDISRLVRRLKSTLLDTIIHVFTERSKSLDDFILSNANVWTPQHFDLISKYWA